MPTHRFNRPRLPSHYYIWFEPPDRSGDEVLRFASARRRIKLKGHSFREFQQLVIPLLDGQHSFDEIAAKVSETFAPEDLEAGLNLLAEQHLLQDAANGETKMPARLVPQLNFFHEVDMDPEQMQQRYSQSTVSVFGLSGAGAGVAQALATAGVGEVRCVDSGSVTTEDTYLSPSFVAGEIGKPRAEVLVEKISASAPEVKVSAHQQTIETEDEVLKLITGSNFVVCCLDQGLSSLVYKLNRACLKANISWTSSSPAGSEIVIGPTVVPFESACYLCYKMRTVACAGNPEEEFAFETLLDRRKQDDSARRENLVFGIGLASNLLSLEAFKALSNTIEPSLVGQIFIFNQLTLESNKHLVLRKPWCPACFKTVEVASAAAK